jgi:hypothetical protein
MMGIHRDYEYSDGKNIQQNIKRDTRILSLERFKGPITT